MAIKDFHENHKVTSGPAESVSLAVGNGCDINCGTMFTYLFEAVREGKLSEGQIDEAVTGY
jgi:beta-glucosidase